MANLSSIFNTTTSPSYMDWNEAADVSKRLEGIIGNLEECYTYDYPELFRWRTHKLFVYGTLKNGFKDSHYLSDFPCIGVGYTKPVFTLYRTQTEEGILPVAIPGGGTESARLYGEVYEVPPSIIHELDEIEENGEVFKRYKLPIDTIGTVDKKDHQVWCWAYVGKKNHWEKMLNSITKCDRLTANKNNRFNYYNFMKKYEN